MHEQLHARLDALRTELDTGHSELERVEQQRMYLRETLLRISGAIQVLEELLAAGPVAEQNGTAFSDLQAVPVGLNGTHS